MKKILVVEDNDTIREGIEEILTLAGYNVLSAINGKDGIESARNNLPDLVISDIMMPVLDGFSMLHLMRRDTATATIPLIFLTAKTEKTDFRNAMEAGADDFITKPFNNDELLKAIENQFKRQEIMKNNLVKDVNLVAAEAKNTSNENVLEQLIVGSETRIYQKKETVYKEGTTPRFLYYVLKGGARTSKKHDHGKDLSIDLYNAGDYLGYVALLENSVYKETAEVLENDTEIAQIPRKNFETVLHNTHVAQKLLKILAHNIGRKEKQLISIAYDTLRQKVAETLLALYKKYRTPNNGSYNIDLSREDLASMAGTATETFIRTLKEFKNEKLIDIKKNNNIEIINIKKLESLLTGTMLFMNYLLSQVQFIDYSSSLYTLASDLSLV